ncbi:hypothetical protein ACS0TY_017117 [Phlomoides rotata]
MRTLSRKNIEILILLKAIMRRNVLIMAFAFAFFWMHRAKRLRNNNRRWFSLLERIPTQVKNLSDLVDVSDDDCKNVLRMDRLTFSRFCNVLVSDGGLKNSKHFKRSGQTISKYFNGVLHCVLKLHSTFLVEPQPVPNDSSDPRWGKFKVDHTVKALRDKSFPYYDHWVDIFGKDRAIGENARDPTDIVDDIHQSGMENQGETGEKLTPDVPKTVEINVTNSVCKPSGSIDVGSTKGKKRNIVWAFVEITATIRGP